MGKADGYLNRCDLWRKMDLDYQATHKFDFYYANLPCDETLAGDKDVLYRGCQTKTTSGRTCQAWNA